MAAASVVPQPGSREQRMGVLSSLSGFDSVKATQAHGVVPSTFPHLPSLDTVIDKPRGLPPR